MVIEKLKAKSGFGGAYLKIKFQKLNIKKKSMFEEKSIFLVEK